MYKILNTFQVIFDFCYEILVYPINFYGVEINLMSVLIFVLAGAIMWSFICAVFDF